MVKNNMDSSHSQMVALIWNIADDVLRDVFLRGQYRDVILPMVVLRRLDALLEPTKEEVEVEITESGYITLAAGGGGTRDCLDTVVAISEDPLPEEPELYENRIKSIDKNEEKVNVKISLETEDTGTLLCSMYDIDGNFIKVCSEDVTKDISNYSFDISDCETVRTVKAFLWDGAETMKPIAQTKDFEILITQKV